MAAIDILKYVADSCAVKNTRLIVAVGVPEVIPLVEEVMKVAAMQAGKPDQYRPDDIHFFPDQAFTVGVVGLMQREQISTGVYAGSIVHDAIILAETGYSLGAFQVAASNQIGNLPFLIACCDYALIGEEMLAAGAYLSRDARALGAILGEDIGKIIALAISIAGIITLNLGVNWITAALKF